MISAKPNVSLAADASNSTAASAERRGWSASKARASRPAPASGRAPSGSAVAGPRRPGGVHGRVAPASGGDGHGRGM